MDTLFIFAAKYLFLLPIIILCIYFLYLSRKGKKKAIIFAAPTLVLTYLLSLVGRHLYYDPRPFVVGHFTPLVPHAPDNGFPSDHTLLAAALAAIGTYLNWRLGAALWIIAFMVAAGRVYVGVHHVIDVVGSILIAIAAAAIIYWGFAYARSKTTG